VLLIAFFTRLNESLFPSLTVTLLVDRVELGEGKIFLNGKVRFSIVKGLLMLDYQERDSQFPDSMPWLSTLKF
jgi:hypothetical protein